MHRRPVDLVRHGAHVGVFRKPRLCFEELEGRYLLFASPADPPVFPSATPLTAVQALGMNALPATDVLSSGGATAFSNAVPWMTSQGGMNTLSQSLGGVMIRTEALGANALSSLDPFSRSSHGMPIEPLPPQQQVPTNPEDGTSLELESAVEQFAHFTASRYVDVHDAAIVSLATVG